MVMSLHDARIRVNNVSCGLYHSMAVTDDGELYSWGLGAYGQLGHSDAKDCIIPTKVEAMEGQAVLGTSCGLYHSAAVSASNYWDTKLGRVGAPSERYGAGIGLVNEEIFMFGGTNSSGGIMGDLHVLDTNDPTMWAEVKRLPTHILTLTLNLILTLTLTLTLTLNLI